MISKGTKSHEFNNNLQGIMIIAYRIFFSKACPGEVMEDVLSSANLDQIMRQIACYDGHKGLGHDNAREKRYSKARSTRINEGIC